jgi:hypothetical protein
MLVTITRSLFCYTLITILLLPATSWAAKPDTTFIPVERYASPQQAEQMIANCPPIAFVKRKNYGMLGTNATMFARRTGVGSAICIYDPSNPQTGIRTIFETDEGFILDLYPSYDGRTLLFSYKERIDQPFHIWEINTDGVGLRQLTSGWYHDFNPAYYPDGRIVFASSRCEGYSYCQDYLGSAIYICQSDGSDIRRIDFSTICSVTPTVLQDGKILFCSWEYQDKSIFTWQGFYTLYPDGRQLQTYNGFTYATPNALYGARQIPGSNKVVAMAAAHHKIPVGEVIIIDRTKGAEALEAMHRVTNATPWVFQHAAKWNEKVNDRDYWEKGDALYEFAYADAWPVTKDVIIASYRGKTKTGQNKHHRLVVMDHDGIMANLLTIDDASMFSAVPLDRRALPHSLPGDVPTESGEGIFHVQDVYKGLLKQGVKRGQVKALRIMLQPQKKYNTEGQRYHDHYPLVGQGSYYIKNNLGTVPVHDDGSAYFSAPSNAELFFQALDKNGKEIQRMGAVLQVTTGETVSCIGCHEDKTQTPTGAGSTSYEQLARTPDRITPPSWGAGYVDYPTQIQPVLDTYCVSCHTGLDAAGDINLTGDLTRFYSMSYEALVFNDYVEYYYINHGPTGVFPALESGSWISKLTQLLEQKHGGVNVDDQSRRAIYAWIDANVPYYSTWDMTRPYSIGGRDAFKMPPSGNSRKPEFFPWVKLYRQFAKKHNIDIYNFDKNNNVFIQNHPGVAATLINFTHPEQSPILYRNLAKSAGGQAADNKAVFVSKNSLAYKELLRILQEAKAALNAVPRIDMAGAVPIPQQQDFGMTFDLQPSSKK